MKMFSRFDLLNNAVVGHTGDIINRMFDSKFVRLDLWVPQYDLKRAQVFVGTVNDLIEDETDERLTVERLIDLFFEDFLRQIDQGLTLTELAEAIEKKLLEQREHKVSINHYLQQKNDINLDDIKQQFQKKKNEQNQLSLISFRILKKFVLRGEVLLHDLAELYPHIQLTVEDLIVLRFRDVMKHIKKGDYSVLLNVVQRFTK